MRRWIFALALAAGCGSSGPGSGPADGGGGGDGGGPPSSLAGAESQLEDAFCRYAVRCGEIGASEEMQCQASAQAALGSFHVSYYSDWIDYSALDAAVAAGRESFNSQVAAACIAAVAGAPCGTVLDVAQDCLKAFTGTVAPGGACQEAGDCASGFCITSGSGCAGTCQSAVAAGARCDGFADACAAGSYCSPSSSACTQLAATGAACEWLGRTPTCQSGLTCDAFKKQCKAQSAAGGSCSFDWDCQSGLRCNSSLQCVAPAPEGGSCQQATDCAAGSFCVGVATATSTMPAIAGTCRAAMGQSGEPCDTMSCAAGLYCDSTARPPVCRGRGGAGSACPIAAACADGTVCVAGACLAFLDAGSACDPTHNVNGCPSDMRCDATSKTCTPAGTAGSSCGGCRRLLYCDASMTCAPQLAPGAACTPPAASAPDPCAVGACDATAHVCAAQSC